MRSTAPAGEPFLDESLEEMAGTKRRADTDTVLLVFKRRVYPDADTIPKMRLIERMRAAIVSSAGRLDHRTVVLISLALGAAVLADALGRDETKSRKERIKQNINGEVTGRATRELIEACEVAVIALT